jgi:hypothetical protein
VSPFQCMRVTCSPTHASGICSPAIPPPCSALRHRLSYPYLLIIPCAGLGVSSSARQAAPARQGAGALMRPGVECYATPAAKFLDFETRQGSHMMQGPRCSRAEIAIRAVSCSRNNGKRWQRSLHGFDDEPSTTEEETSRRNRRSWKLTGRASSPCPPDTNCTSTPT